MKQAVHILSRRAAVFFAVLVLAAAALVLLRVDEMPVGAATDDAYYVEMARSLAEGRGPVIHLHDRSGTWRPDVFPPGLPLLLAPLARAVPSSLTALKLVPLLAWVALVPLCLMWPASGATWNRRLALGILVLANPWTIGYAGRIVSDLPFTALSLGALIAFRAWRREPNLRHFAILITLTIVAVTVRTVGWALPAAMVLHLLLTRRWRPALALTAACGLPLAAIHLAFAPLGAGLFSGSYAAQVLEAAGPTRIELVLGNFKGYLAEVPTLLLPVFGEPMRALWRGVGLERFYEPGLMILGVGFLGIVALGWRHTRTGDGPGLPVIYAMVYGLALVNFAGWPSGVQTRLLLPLLPLLVDGLLGWLEGKAVGRRRLPLGIPAVVLLLGAAFFHNGFRVARPAMAPLYDPGLGSSWLKENSEERETVLVRMPLKQHLHLGRPTVGFGVFSSNALDVRVARFDVRWIIIGPEPMTGKKTSSAMAELLAARPDEFPVVHQDPAGLFRIHRAIPPGIRDYPSP